MVLHTIQFNMIEQVTLKSINISLRKKKLNCGILHIFHVTFKNQLVDNFTNSKNSKSFHVFFRKRYMEDIYAPSLGKG